MKSSACHGNRRRSGGGSRPERRSPMASSRASSTASSRPLIGTEMPRLASLTKASESPKPSRTRRSKWSQRNGFRQSKKGRKKSTLSVTQTHGELTDRPKAPG